MRWVVEEGVFASGFDLRVAARAAGLSVSTWDDAWATQMPSWPNEAVLFHGSLGTAAAIARERRWCPGSFCDADALRWSAWAPGARAWLLNTDALLTTVADLVAHPPALDRVFVRPDSALKPFSGRVVKVAGLTLAALDFGFYYEDLALPVVVAPVRVIEREWRYVVADGQVVSGSAYEADGRRARVDDPGGAPWLFATEVAGSLPAPEPVYVLDVALVDGELRLVELNPFSGADLYACDPAAVVRAVALVAERMVGG